MAASGAPIFYEPAFLDAYQRYPLQRVERLLYREVRERQGGAAAAVLPVTIQPWSDPVGALQRCIGEQANRSPRLLLTHVWHCYDTRLVAASLNREIVDAVSRCLAGIARSEAVELFGFIDVDGSGPLYHWLGEWGFSPVHIFNRHVIDLRGLHTIDDYLATLGREARHVLRRRHRRAQEANVEYAVRRPADEPTLDEVIGLCQASASKHGSSTYYPREELQYLCRALGDRVRLLTVRLRDRLIAGSICLLDDHRFHQWAGGADYSIGERFSPYYELHYLAIETALTSRRERFEGGRGNDDFKRRHGMTPIPLYACLARP